MRLGLDFGTSTCQAAIWTADGAVRRPLPLGSDGVTPYLPSDAFWSWGTGRLVGEEAELAVRSQADGLLLPSAKRYVRFGPWRTAHDLNARIPRSLPQWPPDAPGPLEVSSRLVNETLNRAYAMLLRRGAVVDRAAFNALPLQVSCPAEADASWRSALLQVCREAGMEQVTYADVVDEPICAGVAHMAAMGRRSGEFVVYDYGGGTFDAAWIAVEFGQDALRVLVLSCVGDSELGGNDVDRELQQVLVGKVAREAGTSSWNLSRLVAADPVAAAEWRLQTRQAKEELSFSAQVRVDGLQLRLSRLIGGDSDRVAATVTRPEFEVIFETHFERTLAILDRLAARYCHVMRLERSDFRRMTDRLDGVLLSGGMSQVPYVRQRLGQIVGHERVILPQAIGFQDCVSVGASHPRDYEQVNQSRRSYGVDLVGIDATGIAVGRVPLWSSFEATHQWWQEAIGVWLGQSREVSPPGNAEHVRIAFLRPDGEEIQATHYLRTTAGGQDGHGAVAARGSRLQISLGADSLCTIRVMDEGISYCPIDVPWLSVAQRERLEAHVRRLRRSETDARAGEVASIMDRPWWQD